MKELSIIVPIYNSEKYLETMLNSLIIQELVDEMFEIIIINDNSTDNSLEIINKYKNAFPSLITVINNKTNLGVSKSRNIGISLAKGFYIGFVDSDDAINRFMYSDMLNVAHINNSPDIVSVGVRLIDENLDDNELTVLINDDRNSFSYKKVNPKENPKIIAYESPACWNKIFKASIIKGEFFIDKKWEDIAFSYSILLKANSFIKIDYKYYLYRKHKTTGIMASSYRINDELLDIFDICDYLISKTRTDCTYDEDSLNKIIMDSCLERIKELNAWDIRFDIKKELINKMLYLMNCKYNFNFPIKQKENVDEKILKKDIISLVKTVNKKS